MCAISLVLGLILTLTAGMYFSVLQVSEDESMHAIPKSELIHTEISFTATDEPLSPPLPPTSPPPRAPPPWWVVEAQLPPRPVNPRAAHNATDTFLVKDARPGTVLFAGKGFGGAHSFLNGAAILLLSVCHCQPSIYGVVLNTMTHDTMASAFCPSAAARYASFLNATTRYGGPNAPHWTVLSRSASPGARLVVPGLFAGGSLLDLNRQVARGGLDAGSVAFYSGYVAWRLADLNKQIENGQWLVAKAPASMLLKPPMASKGKNFVTALSAALE